jgi:capsular polysaccharide biosynthesis protein
MTVDEMAQLARRYWFVLLAALMVGVGSGIVVTLLTRPIYIATAKVVPVLADGNANPIAPRFSGGLAPGSFVDSRILEYATFATTQSFLQRVVDTNRLPIGADELRKSLTMSSPKQSAIITITVKSGSAVLAADMANATARVLTQVIPEREVLLPMSATVAEGAVVPRAPAEPQMRRVVLQCSVLGLIFGAVATFGLAIINARSGMKSA